VAGYAGIAGLFVLEALTRRRGVASSLGTSEDDQGTTRMIITAYALAADLPPLLRRLPVPRLPPATAPAGLILEATGLALRAWSMRTLGASYTRTLRTGEDQRVVDEGPYRLIRHPGYAGSLLTWSGFALASRNSSHGSGSNQRPSQAPARRSLVIVRSSGGGRLLRTGL
jgi:hypothetical protein